MAREIQYEAKVSLKGISNLLIQKYVPQEEAQVRTAVTDYSQEWKTAVHLNFPGNEYLVFPDVNIEMTIRQAAKGKKVGKNFMTKMVPTGIVVQDSEVPILDSNGNKITVDNLDERGWYFTCPVVIGKSRVMKTRAKIPAREWNLTFNIEVYNPLLTPKIVKDLFEESGYCSGLGVWRPSSPSPGKNGQFEVEGFELL